MMSGLPSSPTGDDPSVPHANGGVENASDLDIAEVEVSEASLSEISRSEASTVSNVAEPNGSEQNTNSWRDELAARLERYRTRRKPRSPRYPSLLLPFDAPESWSRCVPPSGSAVGIFASTGSAAVAAASPDFAFQNDSQLEQPASAAAYRVVDDRQLSEAVNPTAHAENLFDRLDQVAEHNSEQTAKVIEFPRSAAIPVFHASTLADPIFDRPRIVEAPEILPPPPALGGMLIEPVQTEPADRKAEYPCAYPTASIARRALAALVDGAVVAMSLTVFAGVFFRLNLGLAPTSLQAVRGSLPVLPAGLAVVAVALWAAYEFCFVVYTGSTPGLRAVRLRLSGFDGAPLNRRLRRWRVLASFLSAFCAGLGYLWCALDQDGLCWHDRITRTHVRFMPPTDKN
jgi:uncharacterized RDD family membrane protein YckC